MPEDWPARLAHWADAGVIDAETAERIRTYEASQSARAGLRWPVLIALAFGGVMIACGVLLFVAADWNTLSPAARFGLVLVLTAGFHAAGAFTSDRFQAMGVTLHAIGTVALGAGIALAGQIFNLDEHWPSGVMLWALGAGVGWGLLRQVLQMVAFAVLAPAWLVSEWLVAAANTPTAARWHVAASGVFLLALAYVAASGPRDTRLSRRTLTIAGGAALVPAAALMAATSTDAWHAYRAAPVPALLYLTGGMIAAVGPILVAQRLRGESAWPMAIAVLWLAGLLPLDATATVSPCTCGGVLGRSDSPAGASGTSEPSASTWVLWHSRSSCSRSTSRK